jgi:prepilin-type N-terminal cleavage/methylation domain-containing protein
MPRRSRPAFTLVELLAAISILGLAISGAVVLLDQLADATDRIARESKRVGRERNGARLLTRLLLDAHSSTDSTKRFRGDENGLELWTLCDVPGGWSEECRVVLAIDQRGDSSVLLADLPDAAGLSVRRQAGSARFRYYHPSMSADTLWVRQWSSNVSLPVAIGLVVPGDTVIFPVGPGRD